MSASTKIVLLRSLQGVTLAGAILLSGVLAYAGFCFGITTCGGRGTPAAQADLAVMRCALDMYPLDTGRYPTSEEGLAVLWTPPVYLKGPRLDPWEHEYVYRACPGGIDLSSWGPDGISGTRDDIRRTP
jgi:general secretion pathway protein G